MGIDHHEQRALNPVEAVDQDCPEGAGFRVVQQAPSQRWPRPCRHRPPRVRRGRSTGRGTPPAYRWTCARRAPRSSEEPILILSRCLAAMASFLSASLMLRSPSLVTLSRFRSACFLRLSACCLFRLSTLPLSPGYLPCVWRIPPVMSFALSVCTRDRP
jgi:hypothetical protein